MANWLETRPEVTLPNNGPTRQFDADLEREPCSGGRQMTAHFATRLLNPGASWRTDSAGTKTSLSPGDPAAPPIRFDFANTDEAETWRRYLDMLTAADTP